MLMKSPSSLAGDLLPDLFDSELMWYSVSMSVTGKLVLKSLASDAGCIYSPTMKFSTDIRLTELLLANLDELFTTLNV